MILTINIENTNTIVGCFKGNELMFVESISTNSGRTELEYIMSIRCMFEIYGCDIQSVEGAIVSSVVPPVTNVLKSAVKRLIGKDVLTIGPGVKTGLNIATDNPAQVGSDLVANAVSGIMQYEAPMIIVNMGTATTLSVIDAKKHYVGGMIFPGLKMASDSLTKGTAQLPGISLEKPKKVIGSNTIESMKSGVLYSNASAIDGCISRIEKELKMPVKTVVATGENAKHVVPYCEKKMVLNRHLLLEGLRFIYEKNK